MRKKIVNHVGVKIFVTTAWDYSREIKIVELGPNLFQFSMPKEEDIVRILNGGPWIIDSQILVLKEWEEGIEEDNSAFNIALLWVQVWYLPIHWVSREVGTKIGTVLNKVKEVIIS